ncbi:MAG: right-handed parallel beta-helix repeat-containing protein [Chloroflexi bacterium]|nr:right-handed parallel beta-helix repeat-containing protein [Chloroflexota bacterium]
MKRSLLAVAALVIVLVATGGHTASGSTTVVVSPSNMNGWAFNNDGLPATGALVPGPASPPLGTGSARFTVGGTGGREELLTNLYSGTKFSDITALQYSTYETPSTPAFLAGSLQFDVDYDVTDLGGKWWATKAPGNAVGMCPQSTPCTWAQVLGFFPNAGIPSIPGINFVYFKAGGGWSSFDGNVDAFTIITTSSSTTYDFDAPLPCSTNCYVRTDGNDANSGSANTPGDAKQTIQAAINQVTPGGTVHVGAGTYTEQLDVLKSLTLDGAGAGTTKIQSPATLATKFTTSGPNKPIIYVTGTTGVTVSNLTVDGLGLGNTNNRFEGIAFYNAGGTVDNAEVKGIRETPLSGTQHGVAIYANNADASPRTVTVTNSSISDYQKNGLALNGTNLVAIVAGNNVTGAGITPAIAQNGIQLGFGATGSVTGNTVSGNFCTNVPGGCTDNPTTGANADGAAGILLYQTVGTVTVSGNTVTNNQFGIWAVAAVAVNINTNNVSGPNGNGITVYDCDTSCGGPATGTTGTINGNTVSGQAYGLIIRDFVSGAPVPNISAQNNNVTGSTAQSAFADVPFTATDNWWGTANGPAHASNTFNVGSQAAAVSNNVTFVPWLNAATPTGVSFAPVTSTSPVGKYSSIQAGISGSNAGATVNAVAGTFTENVTVTNGVTVKGAGAASTKVIPALSAPAPCAGSSLCSGAASNVFLVQADNVTIQDLTVDGDNPSLTSGVVAGGADLDARNGIITDHSMGVYQNLSVHDVTVKNIYLRGVYASSGGTFVFNNNTVQNVQADPGGASIAMFNFGGSGIYSNNVVSDANDAIASNWSTGTQYFNNTVTNSGSGVHSDNNGGFGGVADSIHDNTVSNCQANGYGIWTFAPYLNISVANNTVTNCAVGLATAGQNAPSTTTFTNNRVDGQGLAGSTGIFVTTDEFGFGSNPVSATFLNNVITGNDDGFVVNADPGQPATVDARFNSISGNSNSGASTSGTGTLNVSMPANWWGDPTGPLHAGNPAGLGNAVTNGVVYSPWLGIGTDAAPAAGFQLASPMTWVAGPAVCGATCIQAAIDFSANGDTVKAKSGVFNEHVNVNKQITLTAGSLPIIDGGGSGDGITISVPNVTVSSFEVRNVTNGIVIAAGANNATVQSDNIHNFTSAAVRGNSATGALVSGNTINGGHASSCVGGFWGIYLSGVSGTVSTNTVTGIGNGQTSGCQEGRAIEAAGAATLGITNNLISQYQKSGIIVRDTVNSTITGNTVTGEGPTNAIAANGITIMSTGSAVISGNQVSKNMYVPDTVFSCGILYFPVGNPAAGALQVTGNTSTDDQVGICLTNGAASAAVSNMNVSGNTVLKHHQQGINVDTMSNVVVNGNTVDGQAGGTLANPGTDPDTDQRYYGIFVVDSTGTVSNNIIKGITHGPSNGVQSGVGVRVTARSGGTSNVTLTSNNISDVQKNAVVVTNRYGGASVTATISNNTVAGNGPITYIAQNGIQVSEGANATVSGNDISGYDYAPPSCSPVVTGSCPAAAVGLLIVGAGNVSATNNNIHNNMEGAYVQQTNNATVNGNAFTANRDAALFLYLSNNGGYANNTVLGTSTSFGVYLYDTTTNNSFTGNAFRNGDYGVLVDYSAGAPTGNVFNNNCIAGNTTAGMATADTQVGGPINATSNWWGKVNGPNPPGQGDAISPAADINASGFLTAPVAGCPVPADGDGDGFNDAVDNCPGIYNPGQENFNQEPVILPKPVPAYNDATNPIGDNVGDACEADIDHDGIPNGTETAMGLSPYVADTDGDRVNDGTEVACGSNPLNALSTLSGPDTDLDGLPNACEAIYGTDPMNPDTDGDLVTDGAEVRFWRTNPLVKNTDGDDCTDNREIASINGDRNVNALDLQQIAIRFGVLTPEFADFDQNGDGRISSLDLQLVAKSFGPCTAN